MNGGGPAKPDWLAVLERHGYHDQSHLTHDSTHFLHQSPTKVAVELLSGDVICVTRTALLGAGCWPLRPGLIITARARCAPGAAGSFGPPGIRLSPRAAGAARCWRRKVVRAAWWG